LLQYKFHANVCFGSLADIAVQKAMSGLPPRAPGYCVTHFNASPSSSARISAAPMILHSV
jgi:hypothetical protein